MSKTEIPPDVRQLVLHHIPSVERLEILLLLYGAGAQAWSLETVEASIRSTRDSIASNLAELARAGLIESRGPNAFQAAIQAKDAAEAVQKLANAYRERRVAVIELIYSDRHNALRQFSEAFKFGKPR